ncbi:putative ribonuclease H-like domain-containing protein [Tanacetum coccineum]|uniref:Ribonuclease H-like domain-containing protein n=1 Tax=Tanacetum coccineum TaxID=301880 RepID=A0ABQ5B2U2_9ASTR
MPHDQEENMGRTPQQGPTQSWLMTLASSANKPLKTFDELMSTPVDFSAYIINGLKITNMTQETLLGPALKLLKGTRSNYAELEYDFEECYKALSEKLDWDNPEGDDYPFDLTKPIPLVMNGNRQILLVDYFFNNDLKYLQGGILTMTYMTSKTKTNATQHDLLGIEDMTFYGYAQGLESIHDVYSTKRILAVTRIEATSYDFVSTTSKTYCSLLFRNRLTNLLGNDVSNFAIALRIFTRSMVIQKRVEDLQLGVKSHQKEATNWLRTSLDDITKNIQMEYLPQRRWSTLEKKMLGILYNRLNSVNIVVNSASVIVSTSRRRTSFESELLQVKEMADQDTPPPTITAMKIPIIKKGEYDIWSMRMRQYICHTDHNLWDIIVNGDLEDEATHSGEKSSPLVPKTAKQLAARRNQERIKSILLLAIPDEYLLKFHNVPDAKSLWAAIKSRFGGNEESKKMQKNVLKHQFENFVTASNETLDKAYDRFRKLISQLEIHRAYLSKEDINQKFLRSLPPSWSQIALIMRNKPDIDEVDIDDLYNNLRVYEDELKSTASGDFGVSTAGGINQVPSTPSAHDIAYSFLAQPTTSPQLENEDFQQMDGDDLEELDLRWQVAMLTVRVKKFIQRTGRNMDFKEKRHVSLDKSKIECYNCHRKGHFARECRSGRTQDGLGGYDWSNDFEVEPVNYALMAISSSNSSSSSDSEVQKCSKQCLESFKCLQKNYDTEREKHNKAKLEIRGYEIALESLESRILGHEKNELAWGEKYEFQNYDLKCREIKINNLNLELEKVRSSDKESTLANNRFTKANEYHAVPPPITGNPLTPRADISFAGLDEYAFRNKIIESKTTETNKTVDDEDDVCAVKTVSSVKPNVTQAVRSQADKSGQTSQKQGIAVLTRAGLVNTDRSNVSTARSISTVRPVRPVYTVRPVSTARPLASKIAQSNSVIRPNHPRLDIVRPKASNSPIKRSYFTQPVYRPKDLKPDVKTFGVKNMTTVGTRAVVSKGKVENVLKKAKWVWRPKMNYQDHVYKYNGSYMLKKFEYGNPEILLQDHAVVDSGCSSHMTGNKAYLSDYEDFNGGFVAFGSDPKGGKITGKGKIKTANLDFDDVYFVDELKFNLFSVSQMCDKKNSVLFTESECLILSPSFKLLDESQVVLRAPRKDGVYSLDLKNIVPSGGITCLYANATADESKLWHRRLGHVNFKNINKLVKGHLVRGLPSKVFVNDHTCVACKKGKQHKASCKAKLDRIIRKPLELLHMDLFGPVSIESINKKRYCLVVTDDFSRFSWVFFLATKDETSEILCNLIIGLEKQLNHNVKIIRCDNGTEFKNYVMNEFVLRKESKRSLRQARGSVNTGLLCTVLGHYDLNLKTRHLMNIFIGKFNRKSDKGYFLGYFTPSKAFRVYNKRTKRVEENLHINFLEDQPNVAGTGTQDSYVTGSSGKDKRPYSRKYILLPLQPHRTRILVKDAVQDTQEQPSENASPDKDIQDLEDVIDKEGQH